jgi:formate dehydrogenase major subunit/formate dehydrogenase alpha subunit
MLAPEALLEINPFDAAQALIEDGEMVFVASRRGQIAIKARITDRVPQGIVFTSFHFSEAPINQLTNDALDPIAKIPEIKVCAVRLAKIGNPA